MKIQRNTLRPSKCLILYSAQMKEKKMQNIELMK